MKFEIHKITFPDSHLTFKQTHSEKGRVSINRRMDMLIRMHSQHVFPCAETEEQAKIIYTVKLG